MLAPVAPFLWSDNKTPSPYSRCVLAASRFIDECWLLGQDAQLLMGCGYWKWTPVMNKLRTSFDGAGCHLWDFTCLVKAIRDNPKKHYSRVIPPSGKSSLVLVSSEDSVNFIG